RPISVLAFHGTGDRIVPYDGAGKVLPPIPVWAARWAARDGCDGTSHVFLDQDGVVGERWETCDQGSEVILYTIDGGGHTWPGANPLPGAQNPIDATATMWGFFQDHPMP
ncbi:MAG TPA: hypothetical protein VK449_10685, partial [Anaerolineales bacterium]|nr:hypothetical protein [Anaerolineales bacterium]